MAKQTLRADTPVGTFTRDTDTAYKFVTVWASPRAKEAADKVASGEWQTHGGKVAQWAKDNGYGVTWHHTRPSPRSWKWDAAATLVGVYEVKQ